MWWGDAHESKQRAAVCSWNQLALAAIFTPCASAQVIDDALQGQIEALFAQRCAIPACHSGPTPMQGLSLEPGQVLFSTVGAPSTERMDLQIVHPGEPDSSYLLKKVRGDADIIGLQMPFTGDKLSDEEVGLIAQWIDGLDETSIAALEAPAQDVYPFPGWKVVNLPTSRHLPKRTLLFLISHRFVPEVSGGYEVFYGLDGPGIINFSLGYALTDRLLFAVSRSNSIDDLEVQLRYQIARQGGPRRLPVGLAAHGTLNWLTEDRESIEEPIKWALQISATRELAPGLSVAFVPGLLTNPSEEEEGEKMLITLGLGGRWNFYKRVSLVAEWAPMVSGYTETRTSGFLNRYDHFGGGLEIATAGHVFQIVLTNSLGLTTDQYLRGGDLDLLDGEARLGFNIFRMINL